MENIAVPGSTENEQIFITRIYDAPVDQVYRNWTDPIQLAKWWGPKSFTNPRCEIDLRPGGEILIEMKAPDGTVYPMMGIFLEVIEPEKLVFTTTAMEVEIGNWQLEIFNIIDFNHDAAGTKLTVHATIKTRTPESEPAIMGLERRWNESLDRLDEILKETLS